MVCRQTSRCANTYGALVQMERKRLSFYFKWFGVTQHNVEMMSSPWCIHEFFSSWLQVMCSLGVHAEALWEHDMKPTQGPGGFHSCHAWASPCQTPCWWWVQGLVRETSISIKLIHCSTHCGEIDPNPEATVADTVKPNVLMYVHTCVVSTVFALPVSVLHAATSLLQAGTGLSTVTRLQLYVAGTRSHRGLAGFGAAAPKAPAPHCTVLSWMLEAILYEND